MIDSNHISIAIDAMSGDHGPKVVVPAAIQALKNFPQLKVILVGREDLLKFYLEEHKHVSADILARITVHNASQIIAMDEPPASALRNKKDSSMRVALDLVHDNVVKACVSGGNTGALMATARFVLKTLSGIDRPAIISPMPSKRGLVYVLDLGANVECQSEHLYQFAVMGSVLVSARHGKVKPTVGLLNIGSEAIKGTDAVKRAAELLTNSHGINYVGFVEGDDIFKGTVDVVVCDGFTGNVVLKAIEGLVKLILSLTKKEFSRNWYNSLLGLLCKPLLTNIFSKLDPNKYNGGSLVGLRGVVIKSHGNANIDAFVNAIKVALVEAEKNVPDKINEEVSALLQDNF